MRKLVLIFLFLIACAPTFSQETDVYTWYNPIEFVQKFEGQGWSNNGFNRLPEKAKALVREDVWNLSRHNAGINIRFTSNSEKITVRYQVEGDHGMPHMPPTGVSGVDLYVKKNNDWLWCRGRYQFKDTIRYDYRIDNALSKNQEYQLYLPLYNSVKSLQLGVLQKDNISFQAQKAKKPVVVYGTSIAQGACASRPGMAWTNILSRSITVPIINLGFSGNGRLEDEMIELISEIEASLYVLDCLPNLSPNKKRNKKEIQKRIVNCVNSLKQKRKDIPILLVQHAGYSDGLVDQSRSEVYETLNTWMGETYKQLLSEGVKGLHMLSKEEIGLNNDAFVDGTHPTDMGMQEYALAYEKVILNIINK
ncbi:MAG: hydrolase [Maribacter sp.]|nr:hydrolase [Maribacter sp.]